jgi:hypothetical protein
MRLKKVKEDLSTITVARNKSEKFFKLLYKSNLYKGE